MKDAILNALLMYGIAFVMSMFIALLIKGLYVVVRRFSSQSDR